MTKCTQISLVTNHLIALLSGCSQPCTVVCVPCFYLMSGSAESCNCFFPVIWSTRYNNCVYVSTCHVFFYGWTMNVNCSFVWSWSINYEGCMYVCVMFFSYWRLLTHMYEIESVFVLSIFSIFCDI